MGNSGTASGVARLDCVPNPLRRLAFQLSALGPDFSIWSDIDELPNPERGVRSVLGLPQNYRPKRKEPEDWTWFDCHRSIHWGLAKLRMPVCEHFNRVLLPLADGVYAVLPAAAAILDVSKAEDPERLQPLLHLMRESR